MKILITGANGLLGQKLVSQIEKIPEVTCLATSRGKIRFNSDGSNIISESMDITQKSDIRDILRKHNPDVIINTAAITQVDYCEQNRKACYQVNVNAVKYLIDRCNGRDQLFIQLSTDFIFDGTNGPYGETDIPNPISYYGKCKLEAENFVLNSKYGSAVIRTILVYGVNPVMSRSNIFTWVKENLENTNPIKVVNDQVRTPTLVEDLSTGCLLVSKKMKKGIFHIGGMEAITPFNFACQIADFFHLDRSLITDVNANTFSQPAKRPLVTGLIIEKAKMELGYHPHTLIEGIYLVANQLQ